MQSNCTTTPSWHPELHTGAQMPVPTASCPKPAACQILEVEPDGSRAAGKSGILWCMLCQDAFEVNFHGGIRHVT